MNTFSEVDLSLDIQSNVDYPVTINILGNPFNPLDTTNAKTEYRWNLTSFTFTTETQVSVQYRPNPNTTFFTFTQDLPEQTLQAVVSALNLLGIGFFNLYTELGQTYIGTYNDNYTFGDLNIFPTGSTSILNPVFVPSFGAGGGAFVQAVKVQPDGNILFGGNFTQYNATTYNRIIRLQPDGSVDATFVIGTGFSGGFVSSIDVQSDGKILCVGSFTSYNGTACNKIVRLNSDGSIDGTFVYGTGFTNFVGISAVFDVKVLASGKIMVLGGMTDYNGTPINGICRLNSNGSLDGTFSTGGVTGGEYCEAVAEQVDGKYVVVGNFAVFNGVSKNGIVRLNTNGTIDGTFGGTGFSLGVVGTVDVDLQSDGKIVCSGSFSTYNGTSSPNFVRINTNGSIDSTFVVGAGFDDTTNNAVILSSGKIIVGGLFTTYQSSSYNRIIRLNSDGSIDTTWNVDTGFDNTVTQISVNTAETLIYLTGSFTSFQGTARLRACSLIL